MILDPGRTLRVADWDSLYENNRTRELKRMDWLPVPNRMDGDGYTEMVDHPDGASHLGIWLATIQIASRCKPRGTLLRDGSRPHTPQSLARISRLPAALFEQALPRLIEIGWLEYADANPHSDKASQEGAVIPQEGAVIPQEGAVSLRGSDYGREGNGRDGKDTHTQPAPSCVRVMPRAADMEPNDPPSDRFDEAWAMWPLKVERDAAGHAWLSVVTRSREEAAFACIGRYLASDQVARGVVSKFAGWLFQQSRDAWASEWPKAQSREERRQAEIDRHWENLGKEAKDGTED